MIQLGYCLPIQQQQQQQQQKAPTTTTATTTIIGTTVTDNDDDDDNNYDSIGPQQQQQNQSSLSSSLHGNIDWSIWDGGQIGGIPSWLHPEYIPKLPLTCHCTNTKCQCYYNYNSYLNNNNNNHINNTPTNSTTTTTTTNHHYHHHHHPLPNILNFIGQLYAPPPSSTTTTTTTSSSSSTSSSAAIGVSNDDDCDGNDINNNNNNNSVFHRTLYIFGCTQCHLSQCYHRIRVIRTQLRQQNPYWPYSSSSSTTTTTASLSSLVPMNHTKDRTSTNHQDQQSWIAHLPSTYYNNNPSNHNNNNNTTTKSGGGLCIICNFPATGKCPISQRFFCCRVHQRFYYQYFYHGKGSSSSSSSSTNHHQLQSPNPTTTSTGSSSGSNHHSPEPTKNETTEQDYGIYTMMEMVVEEEPDLPTVVEIQDDDTSNQLIHSTLFPNSMKTDDHGDDDDDEDDEDDAIIEQQHLNDIVGKTEKKTKKKQNDVENQRVLQTFISRITERTNCRDQVLRYNCSWPDLPPRGSTGRLESSGSNNQTNTTTIVNGVADLALVDDNDNDDDTESCSSISSSIEPLWIRSDHKPPVGTVPKCPHCHTERQFEFQLMPQLLHYLTVNLNNHNESHTDIDTKTATVRKNNLTLTPAAATKGGTTDEVVLDALRQTETVLEQFHPTNIPPALIEHQQLLIARRRQQLSLQDDDNDDDSFPMTKANDTTIFTVKDMLRPPHDWGVVAVYTCPNSCSDSNKVKIDAIRNNNREINQATIDDSLNLGAYREEYVWVQPPI